MKNIFENFDFYEAITCALYLSAVALACVGLIMACVFESFLPLLLWIPAIACGAVAVGLE